MSPSLQSAQALAAKTLRHGGIEMAALDARALLKTATGLSFEALITNGREPIGPRCERRFQVPCSASAWSSLVSKRLDRVETCRLPRGKVTENDPDSD